MIKKETIPASRNKQLLIWEECLLIKEINLMVRKKTEANDIIKIV